MKIKYLFLFLTGLAMVSFDNAATLKGTYIFQGGTYNGLVEGAPKEYTLQRNYTDKGFTAYAYQKGMKTLKYETGTYTLKADSCFEIETFSSQPSKILGKTVRYRYLLKNNELVLSGTLPTGMIVEEHWKKIK